MAENTETPKKKKKTWSRLPKPKRFRVYLGEGDDSAIVVTARKVVKIGDGIIAADSTVIQFPEAITTITQETPLE